MDHMGLDSQLPPRVGPDDMLAALSQYRTLSRLFEIAVSIASALPAEHNPKMPSIAIALIDAHRGEIARLCALTSVRRLDAFGSVVRADFSPERSDIDLVVEFDALPPAELAEAYFTLKENLEALLGRPIDLLTERSLRNPWLRLRVDSERVPIYAS